MPELIATLTAHHEAVADQNKFLAALKGIKLDDNQQSSQSAEDVWNNAIAKANNSRATGGNDLMGMAGASEGKIDLGLGQGIEVEVIR